MNKIRFYFTSLFLLFTWLMTSQVSITFNVSSHPTPQISEWENRNELAILTVTNTNPNLEGMEFKINAEIYIDDRLVAETRFADMPVMHLPYGTEQYLADMIIPYSALEIYDESAERETIIRTGMLPAGVYSFCVKLVDLQQNTISTPESICRPVFITDYQMPELISPIDNRLIPPNMTAAILFRWTPLSPAPDPQDGVKYLLVASRVYADQTLEQAFLSNPPLIEEEVTGATQMYFPMDVDLPENDENVHLVWSVKPMTLDDTPYKQDNNGFVNLGDFTIGDSLETTETITEDEEEETQETGSMAVRDTIYAGKNGEFKIYVSNLTRHDSLFSGTGRTYVDWLHARVKVNFENIKVDTDKHLIDGEIHASINNEAPDYSRAWASEAIANNAWTNQMADRLINWVESSGVNLPYNGLEQYSTPLELPLGVNLDSGNQLTITEMVFNPNESKLNLVVARNTPPSWGDEHSICFKTTGLEFRPNTISPNDYQVTLIQDYKLYINHNTSLTFKKSDNSTTIHPGCYLTFKNNDIDEVGLEIDATLPRQWLIPLEGNPLVNSGGGSAYNSETIQNNISQHMNNANNLTVNHGVDPIPQNAFLFPKTSLHLTGIANDWDDMILSGNLPKSIIVGTGGMQISANEIVYDMSDTKNPDNIVFPDNYPETSELFRGFYAKNVKIKLPEAWETRQGVSRDISFNNMIIDGNGITMKATARNIFDYQDVYVADLTASLDKFEVEILTNNLVEASAEGKLATPLSNPEEHEHLLQYNALFHVAQDSSQVNFVQLVINPATIKADLFKGELKLEDTSNITAYIDKNKKTFDLKLDGDFSWGNVDLGKIGKVDMAMHFQDMAMHYNSNPPNNNDKLDFEAGNWSFASPSKFISGFPVSIENIKFRRLSANGRTLLKGSLDFDVVMNLTENIGGRTSLGLQASITDMRQSSKFRFKPALDTVIINRITVNADTPAVKIDGSLDFRQEDDEVFGKGFKSQLEVKFKPISLGIKAWVEFGNTDYEANEKYRYWRVETDVKLPEPGVPFLPGIAFRGFGGGAYKNMEPIIEENHYIFKPKKSGWGLKAKTVIATTPKEQSFNSDVDLTAHFVSGSLQEIGFEGAFWLGADFDSRDEAQAHGEMLANYDFTEKYFQFGTSLTFENDRIKANNIQFDFDINGRTGKWFVKLGEPEHLNTVTIKGVGDVNEYLMLGNDIPAPQGFSDAFVTAYAGLLGHNPDYNIGTGGVDANSATGKGFALGANFSVEAKDDFKLIKVRKYQASIHYDVAAGAELNLSMLQYTGGCAGYSRVGINGWRAKGNVGLYAGVDIGLLVMNTKKNKKVKWLSKNHVLDLKVGSWLAGEFPRPSYVAGQVEGSIRFLRRDRNFNFRFHSGTRCNGGAVDSGAVVVQQDALEQVDNELIKYITPQQNTHFRVTDPIAIKYAFTPDEVFDIPEQQADGSIKNRTFLLAIDNVLEEINDGESQQKQLYVHTNNMGEYVYTTPPQGEPIIISLDGVTQQQTLDSIGLYYMEPAIDSNTDYSNAQSSTSGYSTLYPLPASDASYQMPLNANFGNGAPAADTFSGQVPSVGNGYGRGPSGEFPLYVERQFMPAQPDLSNGKNYVNGLKYNTRYLFHATAILKELINGHWQEVYRTEVTKDFHTEAQPENE